MSGLLPIRIDLPPNGQIYEFDGGGQPGTLEFHYSDWAVAAHWRWIWLTLGAFGFLMGAAGWAHPWRRTLYTGLALTFFPLIVAPAATVPCNALLAGWLWALTGWCVTRFLLRRRLAGALAFTGVVGLAFSQAQAAPTPTPAPTPELVIVPYDATKPVKGQEPANYYLPYERFLLLWDAAKHHRRPPAPETPPGNERYTLGTARYEAKLIGDLVQVDAILDLQTFGEGWVAVPLRFETTRVGNVTLDGAPAALGGEGVLWVGMPGGHRVNISLRFPAQNVTAGTRLSWPVPSTAATLVTFLTSRPDLRAELHGSIPGTGEVEEIVPEGRRLTASLGGTAIIEQTFHDVPPPAPAAGLPALASVDTRLTTGVRQESVDAKVGFSFPGSTQDHFTVRLDRRLTLTGLDAPDIRQWRVITGGEVQVLEIDLTVPARDGYRLTLTADRPMEPLPATRRTVPEISPVVARTEQTTALLTDDTVEIALPDALPAGVRRVDAAVPGESHLFAAFAGDRTAVVYSVFGATVKRTAQIDYLYQVGHGKVELAASVRLPPGPASEPLATADLRLPTGFAFQTVVGDAVQQWWREGDVLSLRFRPGAGQAELSLLIYLVRRFEKAPERLTLQPLVVVGFASTAGEAVVAADRSSEIGLDFPSGARSDELSEVTASTAAQEFEVKAPLQRQRAFRYRGTGFDVAATLGSRPARWQTQWVTHAMVRDGAVAMETHVNATLLQGASDTLEFSLPPSLNEARITGADVRDTVVSGKAGERRTYRVIFQNALYAGIEAGFTIGLEIPLDANNRTTLPDLVWNGEGGRTEGGFILVENASAGEMALDPRGLEPAIERDVPFLPPRMAAGTRFFRAAPGATWSLGVQVTALEKTAGRAALVAYADLTSTLRADGEEWHRAAYRLQNRRLQFLPVELPDGVELIGAKVAGDPVRVDAGPVENGRAPLLLVPLVKTRPGELSYDVELTYRRPAPGPAGGKGEPFFGHWELRDPRLPGIPVEKTLWDVYVPPGTRLLNVGGNLEPVVAALSTTEKLESALSDLRELSATYRSASASDAERRRAFDNYSVLAAQVTRQATAKPAGRGVAEEAIQGSLLKKPNAVSQNAIVSRQQQEILSTVDSLSAANRRPARDQSLFLNGGATVAQDNPSSDGFINDGSPINQAASVSGSIAGEGWRDNRINGAHPLPAEAELRSTRTGLDGNQLALNDSVTVNLPAKDAEAARSMKSFEPPESESKRGPVAETETGKRLSTARATTTRVTSPVPNATPQAVQSPNTAPADRIVPPATNGEAVSVRPESTAPPAENHRAEGRISLSLEFPIEGQVYHFKKIESDARLTLWSVRPARFVRLAWLAALLAGLGVFRAIRWYCHRRADRRGSGSPRAWFTRGSDPPPHAPSASIL